MHAPLPHPTPHLNPFPSGPAVLTVRFSFVDLIFQLLLVKFKVASNPPTYQTFLFYFPPNYHPVQDSSRILAQFCILYLEPVVVVCL
jgi:hypothetical protein